MDEREWLASADPATMLEVVAGKVSDRRLRLFACALVRQRPMDSSRCRQAIEVAERFADGDVGGPGPSLTAVRRNAMRWAARCGAYWATVLDIGRGCRQLVHQHPGRSAHQAALLRDLVGNPWRPVMRSSHPADEEGGVWQRQGDGMERQVLAPSALTPTVLSLARGAYEQRLPNGFLDPERLAVLSDALEEAGVPPLVLCPECDGHIVVPPDRCACGTGFVAHPFLAHLRSPGPHAKGCWAVDTLLGRE